MEKKKDFLLIYVVIVLVAAIFGWMWLKPKPVVYYGAISAIERQADVIRLSFVPAQSPFPDYDRPLSGPVSAIIGPQGIQLQIRENPDGSRLKYVDLAAMFDDLAPGDEIGFSFRDREETILSSIVFTTPSQ